MISQRHVCVKGLVVNVPRVRSTLRDECARCRLRINGPKNTCRLASLAPAAALLTSPRTGPDTNKWLEIPSGRAQRVRFFCPRWTATQAGSWMFLLRYKKYSFHR